MKRLLPFLLIALVMAAFVFREQWLPQSRGMTGYLGYLDSDMVLIASPAPGRVVEVKVAKGAAVITGAPLFQLDDTTAAADLARLEASVSEAESAEQNLQSGKRDVELRTYEHQLDEARANLELAQVEFDRARSLSQSGITAENKFEQARAALNVAQARVEKISADRDAAMLPGREAEIAAARSRIAEARAAVAAARSRLKDLSPLAPATGRIDDVFFRAGEFVSAGQPVISLVPDHGLILRFFVPEDARTRVRPGVKVNFHCDDCPENQTATVTHVFAQPEYTPPVIYSQSARSKLVYQVEAQPDAAGDLLQPGLPVDVGPVP